jgi:hypothetical protein
MKILFRSHRAANLVIGVGLLCAGMATGAVIWVFYGWK